MKFLKAFLLITLLSANFCYAGELASVLGYQNTSSNELWQQKQIGFGVTNILQQQLLDNTDFSLLDGKVALGINNEAIETQLQEYWMLNENQTSADTLKGLAEKNNLTHIFWAKITDFISRTSKISLGPFSSTGYKDTLTLEVCHYTVTTNTIECQEGEATQTRTLTGVLYKPTANVNFSESGAGRLSQEAITQSLTKLLHHEK